MTHTLAATIFIVLLASCSRGQNQREPRMVGGPCEGCEAVLEYGDKKLTPTDTLPDFHEKGTRIKVEGTIFQSDGKTPAKDVILYAYHTDQNGRYSPKGKQGGWAQQHGYIRGWIKTDKNGRYAFFTLKPAPYPNRASAAHIHYTILEPNGKYYWLESCHFEGDSLLTKQETHPESPRGGSVGLLTLRKEDGLWAGSRDIILGKNVPDYE